MEKTENYSGSDIVCLVRDAAMMPLREIPTDQLLQIKDVNEIRGVTVDDFYKSMKNIVPSVSRHSIMEFENWMKEKGNPV